MFAPLTIIFPAPPLISPPSQNTPLNVANPLAGIVMVYGPSLAALLPPPKFTAPLNVIGVALAMLRFPLTNVIGLAIVRGAPDDPNDADAVEVLSAKNIVPVPNA